MQYVVCYDIADDRRRERISAALLDFGPKIQESVHLATLDEMLAKKMKSRLTALMDAVIDKVHIFPLCGMCGSKAVTLGAAESKQPKDYYIV